MAVQDKYVDAQIVAVRTTGPLQGQGGKLIVMGATFEVAAADDDGSVYRVHKSVPASLVPIQIRVGSDAITGSTDWDVGLYKPNLGAVVSANVLADALSLAAGYDIDTAFKSGLKDVDLANRLKMLWELASQSISSKAERFDIALTANTVGSAAGTVTVLSYFMTP